MHRTEALARSYGGQLELYASSDMRQFVIAMLPPRVREVVEIAQPENDPLATPLSVAQVSTTTGLTRHLGPVTLGSSSSGTYLYDGAGNIKSIGSDSFVYDSVGRLTEATVQGNQQSFTYDAFGNRLSATRASGAVGCVGGCEATVTVVSGTNHLSEQTYDDAGNVLGGFGAAYTYDGTGMVTGAIVGSDQRDFAYTADDERIAVRQGVSWTWTVREQGGKVLREFTATETSSPFGLNNHYWSKDYVWRDGLLLASVFPNTPGSTTSTTTYHYHLDHLGTPRLVTRLDGTVVGKHTYYPFGSEMDLTPKEPAVELMKFTGHERDIVAGDSHSVDYMHARYYNGNLGRFLSVDRGRYHPTLPQSWNRYSYAYDNPLRHIDPDGRDVWVAPALQAAVTNGLNHSLSFRNQYNRLNNDHRVYWNIQPELFPQPHTRAHSSPLELQRDPSNGNVLHAGQTSLIPTVQIAVATQSALIAHEGQHLVQELDNGHTILERVARNDHDIVPNREAGPNHFESVAVREFEQRVIRELAEGIQLLPEGREVVKNMLDLTPAQR